jgi:hypothetical protein
MAGSARVTSVAAIEDFKGRLVEFGVEAGNALASLGMEIRRLLEWLDMQAKHWQREVRRRQELVSRAKSDLDARKWMSKGGTGPGTTDQEIALEDAVNALRRAEDKVDRCRHWSRILPQEVFDCEGPANALSALLESDLRQAVSLLDQKIAALEAYIALVAPSSSGAVAPGGSASPPDEVSAPAEPKSETTVLPGGGS